MALADVPPQAGTGNLFRLKEIVALLRETPYPASESTLNRWIKKYGIPTEVIGRRVHVPYTPVLLAQKEEARRAGIPL